MVDIIEVADLPTSIRSNELVDVMVAGANAKAARVAPCLVASDPTPDAGRLAEAKLVLLGAVKRWAEAGSGAIQQQTAGPFGMTVDTRQKSSGYNLWPSEITELQQICAEPGRARASSITPTGGSCTHLPWCSLMLGATYCSCGADIAGYPIYELDEA